MAYQEKQAAGTTGPVFIFAVVMVFLLLAAQYESWLMPLAIVLSVPTGVLGALLFVWGRGEANDVYSSVGLVMLVGLIAKNAILIVEFARQQRTEGKAIVEASIEAAHLRLRPILMTSFAFILGVVPLVLSSGAGPPAVYLWVTPCLAGCSSAHSSRCLWCRRYMSCSSGFEWRQPAAVAGGTAGPAIVHAADGSAMPAATLPGDGSSTPASDALRRLQESDDDAVDGFAVVAATLLAGCMLGPDYQRPTLPLPAQYRDAEPPAAGREAFSLADLQWFELFRDDSLQALVYTALQQNYDVRIAVARIMEAQAQLGITRSFLFPQLDGHGTISHDRISEERFLPPPARTKATHSYWASA
jgi:hypothetical protein